MESNVFFLLNFSDPPVSPGLGSLTLWRPLLRNDGKYFGSWRGSRHENQLAVHPLPRGEAAESPSAKAATYSDTCNRSTEHCRGPLSVMSSCKTDQPDRQAYDPHFIDGASTVHRG